MLGILGLMLIIGVSFDIYNLLKKEDKETTDGTGDFTHGFTYSLRNTCSKSLKTMIRAQHFIY